MFVAFGAPFKTYMKIVVAQVSSQAAAFSLLLGIVKVYRALQAACTLPIRLSASLSAGHPTLQIHLHTLPLSLSPLEPSAIHVLRQKLGTGQCNLHIVSDAVVCCDRWGG